MFQAIYAVFNKGSDKFKKKLIEKLMSQELDEKIVGKEVSEQEKEVLKEFKNDLVEVFEDPAIKDGDLRTLLLLIFNSFESRYLVYEILCDHNNPCNQSYLAVDSNLNKTLTKWNCESINCFRSLVETLEIDDAKESIQSFLALQILQIPDEIEKNPSDLKEYLRKPNRDLGIDKFLEMEHRFTLSTTMMDLHKNVVKEPSEHSKPSEHLSKPKVNKVNTIDVIRSFCSQS